MVEGILIWLYHGMIFGLILGVVAMSLGFTVGLPLLGVGLGSATVGMVACLLFGLAIGLNIGLTAGLLKWLTIQRDSSSIVPKEDVPSAAQNVLVGGLASAILWGMIYASTLRVILGFFD